jgi:hypothetical protein
VTAGIFCRRGDGDEAYLHVGANALGMVEIAILGIGRGTVLLLTVHEATRLASTIQQAARDAAVPPENGEGA